MTAKTQRNISCISAHSYGSSCFGGGITVLFSDADFISIGAELSYGANRCGR